MGTSSAAKVSDPLRDLMQQVQDLQRRVSILEQGLKGGIIRDTPEAPSAMQVDSKRPAASHLSPNVLPVLGRVLVAIAGAYVLRALTDLGVMPRAAGVAVGILYAVACLFVASRLPENTSFAIAMTCSASMLILGPLVWESCVRLKAMSDWTSAAVLGGFALVAIAVSWRKHRIIIPAIVLVSSTLLSAALLVATDDLFPFTLALLTLAAFAEFAASRDHPAGSRWLSAAAADCAVLLFSWLMARKAGLPDGYVPTAANAVLAAQLLLIAIYIASAVTKTLVNRRTLGFPEMTQTACALLIGIGGMVWVFGTHAAAMMALGVAGLIGGIACYAIAFLLVAESKWNFRAWASYGLFLVLAGTSLLFSGYGFWALWCACSVACCWAAMAARRPTLGLHGAVYLLLGSAVSGASGQSLPPLLGIGTASFEWLVPLCVLAAAMLSWVAIFRSWPGDVALWRKRAASFAISSIISWILAGAAARVLILSWLMLAERTRGPVPAGTIGTVVLATFAVALAWAGARWPLRELVWLAYGFMGLGAWNLAARDFVNERDLTLIISLLFYGGALILLPRMLHRKWTGETATI